MDEVVSQISEYWSTSQVARLNEPDMISVLSGDRAADVLGSPQLLQMSHLNILSTCLDLWRRRGKGEFSTLAQAQAILRYSRWLLTLRSLEK